MLILSGVRETAVRFSKLGGLILLLFAFSTKAEELLIFVSFSMPEESLRIWMKDANKLNAPILLQGLHNNSMRQTSAVLLKAMGKDLPSILIDPERFTKYKIDKVPAVVIATKDKGFDVIYGDQSLASALEKLSNQGVCEHYINLLLDKLRESA